MTANQSGHCGRGQGEQPACQRCWRIERMGGEAARRGKCNKRDPDEWAVIYAKVFAPPDGQEVLAHLQAMTLDRVLPASATDAELRQHEGKRELATFIAAKVKQGMEG